LDTKKCSKCCEVKPVNEFALDSLRRDGLNIWCKQCGNEYQKKKRNEKKNNKKLKKDGRLEENKKNDKLLTELEKERLKKEKLEITKLKKENERRNNKKKKCFKCGELKTLDAFDENMRKDDARQYTMCKECAKSQPSPVVKTHGTCSDCDDVPNCTPIEVKKGKFDANGWLHEWNKVKAHEPRKGLCRYGKKKSVERGTKRTIENPEERSMREGMQLEDCNAFIRNKVSKQREEDDMALRMFREENEKKWAQYKIRAV